MGNVTELSCSEIDSVKTGAGTIDDADGLEGAKSKINIIMPDKTNKIPILVSY